MVKAPLQPRDIINLYDQSFPVFQDYWDKAEENERYKRVENFSDAEKAQIEGQGRQAYAIPLIASKVNQHLSHQIKNRTEWRLEALQDRNDEVKAQVGNVQFRDLEHRCDMIHLESDVFDSGVSVLFGASEIYLDYDKDLNPVPAVKELDYRDVMWDANSVAYNKDEDALWMAKMTKVSRLQIREEYGDEAAKVLAQDFDNYGRKNEVYYLAKNKDRDYDVITLFTHYHKVLRKYHLVLFNDYANLHGKKDQLVALKTRSKKEADRYLRELEIPYLTRGLELSEKNGIEIKRELGIDKYVLTYNKILEYEETEYPHFPIHIYHSYFYKGKFWTLTDVLKSAQRFIDRYLAQIDYSFGTDIKSAYEINVNLLADGLTLEDALEALHQDGYIPVKANGAIKSLRGAGINPQWVNMIQVMQSYLEDLAGGRSFQGLSESKDESGKAIKLKQEQGAGLAALFVDNLNRWKRDLGKKLLWWFQKYDTAERVIKVGGTQMNPQVLQTLQQLGVYQPSGRLGSGYLRINTPLTHLRDAEFELKVTEAQLSETAKERRLGQLALLGQMNPNMAMLPKYNLMILESAGLDYSDIQELKADYENMLKAQAEAQQKEQEMEQQSQSIEDAVKVAELKLKKEELGIKRDTANKKPENKPKGK